jgi:Ca2+-binding RTX toxin-like protein
VNQTSPYHSDAQIETIILDDDTIDLTQNLTLSGTETSEYLHGTYGDERILALGGHDIIYAYSGNDTLHGGDGIDTLYGQNGDDILYGENDSDYIFGGYGSDVLIGGDGKDYLYGQGDTDTFAFESSSAFNNIDVIEDFKLSEQDKLDISDLLQSYDPVSDAITDFVQITEVNYTSYLEVDVDGGGDDFVRIAQINNTTGITDEYALVNLGHLIV